jgi:hypothetical protein
VQSRFGRICPTPNPNYLECLECSREAEATTDSDSHYSERFDSANAPDLTPPNAHMGTPTTQSVHSIEACYNTPVGHFHVEHEALRKVEVQHPRPVNPRRRVGKKKPLDPRPRQTPTKTKRNEDQRVESKIHKQPLQRRKSSRFKHNRRPYISRNIDQRQVCNPN